MAPGRDAGIPPEVVDTLELILFGAIGLTTVALADAGVPDLTLAQWRALVVIGRADGLRVGEVAERIGVSMPSTSRLLSRMERRGYLVSERDPADRRATLVRLSDRGHHVRAAVIERRRSLLHGSLAAIGRPLPRDLGAGLAAVAKAIERYE
jgi:DNA-binding MarR family transcriptional regulator